MSLDALSLRAFPLGALRRGASLWGLALALQLAACSREERQREVGAQAAAALAQDPSVVALVGTTAILRTEVQQVMAARGLDARAARDALVRDTALAASVAGSEQAPRLASIAHARALLDTLLSSAPPTEAEVAQFTERHWLEFDRPESSRVTHAVVICEECSDPGAARALAERIAKATAGVSDPAAFKAAAGAVDAGSQKVAIEDLQPVAADGRTVALELRGKANEDAGRLHTAFAEAAAHLPSVGSQSPVVQSPSGFHVLLLTERIPELRAPFADRVKALGPEIRSARAKALEEETLSQAKQRWQVEVSRSVAQDTESILSPP